jgi:hypothetical protein
MEKFPTEPDYLPQGKEAYDTEGQLFLFAHALKPFQEPNWPYHNWEWHIDTSFKEAMLLCGEYELKKQADQPSVNRLVVGLAILGHDSGYSHFKNEDELLEATGFESKEAYSCYIVEEVMKTMEYDQDTIEEVKVAIMATKRGSKCTTIESWIVRRADLFNIASDYETFKTATGSFRDEVAMLSGKNKLLTIGEFMCLSWPVLRDYILDDHELWPSDKHALGHTRFYVKTCLNVYRLLAESGIGMTTELTRFIKELPSKITA